MCGFVNNPSTKIIYQYMYGVTNLGRMHVALLALNHMTNIEIVVRPSQIAAPLKYIDQKF